MYSQGSVQLSLVLILTDDMVSSKLSKDVSGHMIIIALNIWFFCSGQEHCRILSLSTSYLLYKTEKSDHFMCRHTIVRDMRDPLQK